MRKPVLMLLLLVHVACWWIMKPVAPKTDDLVYALSAKDVLAGTYHLTDSPKNHRVALIYPAAFFIRVLGDHPAAISLFALLCSLATVALIYFLLKKKSDVVTPTIASLLLCLNTLQITYSTALFPDVIVSFYMLMCCICLYNGRSDKAKENVSVILFILFFIAGFFSKEIIVLLIPFVLFLFAWDISLRRNFSFWMKMLAAFAGSLILILFLFQQKTGSWFFLYDSVSRNHNDVFVPLLSAMELIKRLSYEPFLWLMNTTGFSFLFILSVPAIVQSLRKSERKSFDYFIAVYFLFLLLMFWFGSSSFTRMAPMLLYPRMWIPLLAPLCILSAFTISKIATDENKNTTAVWLSVVFAVAAIINNFTISGQRAMLFGMFAMTFFGISFLKKEFHQRKEILVGWMVCPFVILCIYFLWTNSNRLI